MDRNEASYQPCLSSGIYGKQPLADCVRPIAEAGFKWIEISRRSTLWREACPVLADAGVTVWSIHGRGVFCLDDPSDEICEAAIEKEKLAMAEAAPYAPCPYVLHYFRGAAGPENDERCVRRIKALARCAADEGFELSIELLPCKASVNRHVGSAVELVGLLDRIVDVPVSVCIDMNHTNLVEELPPAIRACRGRLGNVHISDNMGKTDDHLLPGEGVIEWPPVIRALRDVDYQGTLNMEIHLPEPPSQPVLVQLREWAETMAHNTAGIEAGMVRD